jgi:phosphonate transport system substrate-binding protein
MNRLRALAAMVALGALLGAAAASTAADPAGELNIVFIAYQNPNQLMEDVRPVVAYLEKALSRPIRAFAATDYAGVVEALRYGSADVGFMGPLQYVLANEQAGAYPILGEIYAGSSTYTSRIFVRKDSGIATIEDLEAKTMAFVDPISSSGFLYPLDIFTSKGLVEDRDHMDDFFKRVYFAGGDEQAMRAVLNGFVDAAGVGQFSFNLLRPEERDQITEIATSQPIPSHCIVVRKGLDKKAVEDLRSSLLALNEGADRHLLKYLYNVDGYVTVDEETYRSVARLARDHGFLK